MNLLKPLVTLSFITMISRVLGFIRDMLIAKVFGIGMATDAFFIAFRLPNLLRCIFAEGAFFQVFVPILEEYKSKEGKDAARIFVAYVSGLLTLSLAIITFLGVLLSPFLVMIIAPGFTNTEEKFLITTKLLRITFPYILYVSLSSMATAILNTWNYFSIPAFAPFLLNISIIIFTLFSAPYFDPQILSLAWAVKIGGILQLLYQLPYLRKIGMLVLPRIDLRNKETLRLIKQLWPSIIGVSVNQILMTINTIFASFLVSGSISWIYYADRLIEFPSGVMGAALGTILLSSLSRNFVSGNYKKYSHVMDYGLRICFLFALPSAVGLGILSKPLIISLFQYGKFTEFDTKMTHQSLIAYSVGLIGLLLVKVLVVGFYARQDVKTPMKVSMITIITTQFINLVFIHLMKHTGLSLSISLSNYLNAALLYWQLRKQRIFSFNPGWLIFSLRVSISVLIMAFLLIGILHIMPEWSFGKIQYRLIRLIMVTLVGGIVYISSLILLKFRIKEFIKHLV